MIMGPEPITSTLDGLDTQLLIATRVSESIGSHLWPVQMYQPTRLYNIQLLVIKQFGSAGFEKAFDF